MLAGHMDEIGLQITNIDNEGYLRFAPIGGWDPQVLPGQRVWIQGASGRVDGIIGKAPIHVLSPEDRKKVVQFKNLWIDIGAADKEDAMKRVSIGDAAVLAHGPADLSDDLLAARGLDNRVGAFIVFQAARLLAGMGGQVEVHAVATVQEEIGLRGAVTSAYRVKPLAGIAVDVTHATDYPGMKDRQSQMGQIKLGGGPAIARGPNINPRLMDLLVDTARDKDIPFVMEAEPRGTPTDANAMQLARGGTAAALLSVPNRYMHTPVEMVSRKDLTMSYTLLAEAVNRIGPDTSFTPW